MRVEKRLSSCQANGRGEGEERGEERRGGDLDGVFLKIVILKGILHQKQNNADSLHT